MNASSEKKKKTIIRNYIAKNIIYTDDGFGYSDDASLVKEGIVDSFGVMELAAFIEEEFGVSVQTEDITPANFDTINNLTSYVQRRKADHVSSRQS